MIEQDTIKLLRVSPSRKNGHENSGKSGMNL